MWSRAPLGREFPRYVPLRTRSRATDHSGVPPESNRIHNPLSTNQQTNRGSVPQGKRMKVCKKCGVERPLSDFYKRKKSIDGKRHTCKHCSRKAQKTWRDTHPDNVKRSQDKFNAKESRRLYRRNWYLFDRYGIGLVEYNQMLEDQNGKCAICGTRDPGGQANIFHVDHEHTTGKIRGLLCNNCNPGLGWFKDNEENLLNAIAYLRKHR